MNITLSNKEQLLVRLALVNSMRNITEARDRAITRHGDNSNAVNNFRKELVELEALYARLCE